ncbi:MAG: class I SAM-dependent methyltransferase [Methanosarcinaceae archaeon]|nr:class I SAM-dependent methyltransferase [Methanosarcinaceae archaeon]
MGPASTPKSHFLAWEQEYSHVIWGGPRLIDVVRTHLAPASRVLDAGCGNGRYLLPLSRVYRTVGVDVSATAVKISKSYLEKSNLFSEYAVSAIHHLPFAEKSFDAIVCFGVLQHLFEDERRAALDEFRRVLVQGGLLFAEVLGVEDMRYGGEEVEPHTFLRRNGIIYHYFTAEEMTLLLDGFEIMSVRDVKKEKTFRGRSYTRHRIHAVARLKDQNASPR